jgi:hypothetical protein
VTFHRTPTGSSWLNQVEIWLGIITKQAIRRGTFGSVQQLINTINTYIDNWNLDAEPFTWTATADGIIAKVRILHQGVLLETGLEKEQADRCLKGDQVRTKRSPVVCMEYSP